MTGYTQGNIASKPIKCRITDKFPLIANRGIAFQVHKIDGPGKYGFSVGDNIWITDLADLDKLIEMGWVEKVNPREFYIREHPGSEMEVYEIGTIGAEMFIPDSYTIRVKEF